MKSINGEYDPAMLAPKNPGHNPLVKTNKKKKKGMKGDGFLDFVKPFLRPAAATVASTLCGALADGIGKKLGGGITRTGDGRKRGRGITQAGNAKKKTYRRKMKGGCQDCKMSTRPVKPVFRLPVERNLPILL